MRHRKLNLKSTFFNLLGQVSGSSPGGSPPQIETLRAAMLEALGDAGVISHPQVARKLRFADDALGLWYVRAELMTALAEQHGESQARRTMDRLSRQFAGLLPAGMNATTQSSRR